MMRLLLLLLSLGLVICLSACDEKPQKRKKVVRPHVVTKKPVAAVPQPSVSAPPVFRYIVGERRDPFTSLLAERKPLQEAGEPETPLQQFGLNELRLSAIVIGKGEPRAMLVAPNNKAYIISAGVKIGRNQGVVTQITQDEVVVQERFEDFSGALKTEIKKITLPSREGE
jgi:type IV pilus assembly protein PilP